MRDYTRGCEAFHRGDIRTAREALAKAAHALPNCPDVHAMLGVALLTDGEPRAATPALEAASELAPSDTDIKVWLAAAYACDGRDAAAHCIIAGLDRDAPGQGHAMAEVGRWLLRAGRVAEAAVWLQGAAAAATQDSDVLYDLAWALVSLGDTRNAEHWARTAMQLASDREKATTLLAHLLTEDGRTAEALHVVAAARDQGAESPALANAAGWAHQDLGNYGVALREHEQACALADSDPAGHLGRAAALVALGSKRRARRAVKTAERLLREHGGGHLVATANRWHDVSVLNAELGHMVQAERAALLAIEIAPEILCGYRALAAVRALQRDRPGLVAVLAQARSDSGGADPVAMGQMAAHAWTRLGRDCLDRGELIDAIISLRSACQAQPDVPDVTGALAWSLGMIGEWGQAERLLRRAVAVAPANVDMWVLLASACMEFGHTDEALEAVAKARGSGVDDAQLCNVAGRAHLASGEHEAALSERERACSLAPEAPEMHLGRALTLAVLGDVTSAEAAARQVERLLSAAEPGTDRLVHALVWADTSALWLRLEECGKAARAATRAVKAAPEIVAGHHQLARVRVEEGDVRGVASALRRAAQAYGTVSAMEPLAELAEELGLTEVAELLRARGQDVTSEVRTGSRGTASQAPH